jgi:hypothetical protein
MPVACFQAVGESLKIKTHPVWMWIGFEKNRRKQADAHLGIWIF